MRWGALLALLSVSLALAQGLAGFSSADVIQFVRKTSDWYRQTEVEQQQIGEEPADVTYLADQQRMAAQIVRWGFEFARQAEPLVANRSAPNQPQNAATPIDYQSLTQAAAGVNQQVSQIQGQLEALGRERTAASRKRQEQIDSESRVLESELGLLRARQDALNSMITFVTGTMASGMGTTDLHSEIQDLAGTLPFSLTQPQKAAGMETASSEESPAKPAIANRPPPAGLLGLASESVRLSRKVGRISDENSLTRALGQSTKQLSTPLLNRLRQMIQTGQAAVSTIPGDPASLAAENKELDALTLEFKQASAALLPLNKQAVLLDLYQTSLNNWLNTVRRERREVLESLLLRLAIVAILIALVLGIGELLRKTIFRYVPDGHRRYQFLVLRKIALWVGIGGVLVFALASELGSLVTFAGLITAGVAVALQNVIVSMVGYFFLIGKYGIRVGDRVQLAGVTGEVVDLGLVRFYLMELESRGAESLPTGRVVAFSNSIVFQSGVGLFKQIVGTNFLWHEVKLTFSAESDYEEVGKRLHEAIAAAFRDYQDLLERQRRQLERSLNIVSAAELKPSLRLHFTLAGREAVIEYPVVLEHAAEIDEKLMKELLTSIDREPRLKLIGPAATDVKLVA
ncbi:MAG TPA: mechanosensitive ion channel family protein [Terriglobales bacterium]|nr:mechanosensitive ion channel family protein [Terriglobales bacterium]